MAKVNVTIVGLGFVGSSIGLAVKASKADVKVIGHDKEPTVARKALKKGAVDKADWNLISACEQADIIVIATPLMAVKETMEAIAPYIKPGCLVTDTATIKGPVISWADEILPDEVNFIGGNPIIENTTEITGADAASAEVLKDALYCLIPSPKASGSSMELATAFVTSLGARPYFLDAAEHD
ncbi:MAG: prephenate dehydrogenase/arogenate dehydrogenase family protein, partial [Chloroflexi bacterium]